MALTHKHAPEMKKYSQVINLETGVDETTGLAVAA